MIAFSITTGPGGDQRIGCMFCGAELDFEGKHETTGNFGCVSPTNPARLTKRREVVREYRWKEIHFDS